MYLAEALINQNLVIQNKKNKKLNFLTKISLG